MNPLFAGQPTTIFEEMSGLARHYGAINLGQGFPDEDGPLDVRERAARALIEGPNQYPPMWGVAALREGVCRHYLDVYGLTYAPEDEALVTAGATEALAAAILALVTPGDEVVLFEPMFDVYLPLVLQAGGIPRFVTLRPPDWAIDPEALAEAFGPKTRLVVFNSPHNPAAKVYEGADLEALAAAVLRTDALVLCDEVWEHVIFDGRVHRPLASLPGMRARCVKIGSGGKMFSLTGWKVGWACGPRAVVQVIAKAHQFLTFTVSPATQTGIAFGLAKPPSYFMDLRTRFQTARDRLTEGLQSEGFNVLGSEGTYFLLIDLKASGITLSDREFCLRAVAETKVAAIPLSAFYAQTPGSQVARLCLAKNNDTLDAGVWALGRARRLFGDH